MVVVGIMGRWGDGMRSTGSNIVPEALVRMLEVSLSVTSSLTHSLMVDIDKRLIMMDRLQMCELLSEFSVVNRLSIDIVSLSNDHMR